MHKLKDADCSDVITHFRLGEGFNAEAFQDSSEFLDKFTYVAKSVVVSSQTGEIEQGLFTSADIEKGDYVGTYFGDVVCSRVPINWESVPKFFKSIFMPEESKFIVPDFKYVVQAEGRGNAMGIDGKNSLRYANHQQFSSSNMVLRGFNFYASKNIKSGEELTWPYGLKVDNNFNEDYETYHKALANPDGVYFPSSLANQGA